MRLLSILILSVVALSSCATLHKKDKIEEAKEKSRIAMDNFNNCTVKSVDQLDDGYSDASTIALALTNYCMIEYDANAEAHSLSSNQNNKEKNMYTNNVYTKEAKIEASINTVLKYRHDKLSTITKKTSVPQ
ncbi:MAG: hypothetical protein P4L44_01740 [Oryzomonas sp.]|uniref:hypothetical protein n=1 Tax=Oryzomonas sp. TaxID=2855186 RepID=UPI00284E09C7|nr:hypothetical protein [Oryzomonas sp.]MDR3578665.1 hypothetical protein [Oryzomonas sp.]